MVPRFLLVSLSIAAILGEATIHKRRERLGKMTSGLGLDGAYDATLSRIKGQGKGKSALGVAALMWIFHSEHPMHVGELREALGVEVGSREINYDNIPSEKTLLASCLGLVTVDESSTVRLVHFTLQEYFNNHSEHFENPQSTMAEVCLTYLNFDSVNELSHNLYDAPEETRLLQYASSYWGMYARNGLTEGVKSLALQLLRKFGKHISAKLLLEGGLNRWRQRGWYSEGFTGLHCAAYLGLDEIAIAWLEEEEGCVADMVDRRGVTPLGWAASCGHGRIVELLLNRKEVNPGSRTMIGQTPLCHAASGGHEGIVKLLLDRKEVNPDSRADDGQTPLCRAASGGHEGIVKLLLDRKEANPDFRGKYGQTPLWYAAKGGHEGVVKLLLDRKEVNPGSRTMIGQTPLCRAASGGHEGIVKLLLDRKEVNPDSRDNGGRTPLWYAASGGHEGIVKLLLDRKGVNPDLRGKYGQTPLWRAAEGGHEGIVKLLLDRKGVNPDSGDRDSQTPLCCAAEGGHEGIVKLLLDRKEVNPGSRDKSGQTPLWYAAEGGHEGVVKLLLGRKEVDPDLRDKYGLTPLWYAASDGHEGIVNLLQRHANTESGTGANDAPVSPSHLLQNSYEGLPVLQLSSKPPRDTPDLLTQNTHPALSSAVSPPDTPDIGSETCLQAPPLDSPLLALLNPLPLTVIAAAVAAILATIIRIWLQYLEDSC